MIRIEGVVAVQNHGTSGSTLMQSLLDFHPRLLSLPCLHGHSLYQFWEASQHLSGKELLDGFLKNYAYWENPSLVPDTLGLQEMGENCDQPTKIDLKPFAEILKTLGWNSDQPIERKLYIQSIYIAYAQALGRKLDTNNSYWIVFPIHGHSVKRALYLTQDFDKAFFLHTTRNPIQNMGSGAKHIRQEPHFGDVYLLAANTRQVFLEHAVHIRCKDVRGIHYYVNDSADGKIQSKTIRLEDMHKDSENTMRSIAEWLRIEWDPILLKSTYDGKLWNNRPTSIRQAGLGGATIKQEHKEIFNRFDKWRLFQTGKHVLLSYHYAKESDFAPQLVRRFVLPLLLLLPFKIEWTDGYYRQAYPIVKNKCARIRNIENIAERVIRKLSPGIHRRITSHSLTARPFRLACNVIEWIKNLTAYVAIPLTLFKWVSGIIWARISLLTVWAQSFKPLEQHHFVPLLHYKKEDNNQVSDTKLAA